VNGRSSVGRPDRLRRFTISRFGDLPHNATASSVPLFRFRMRQSSRDRFADLYNTWPDVRSFVRGAISGRNRREFGGEPVDLANAWRIDTHFHRASLLVREIVQRRESTFLLAVALGRHPRRIRALASWWRHVPELVVNVSVSPSSMSQLRDILASTSMLPILGREPISVLEIPDDVASYMVGRHRQAIRTNQSRAIQQGCTVEVAASGPCRTTLNRKLRLILGDRPDLPVPAWPIGVTEQHVGVVGKRDNGEPIVLGAARVFGQLAVLEMFLRFDETAEASACRSLVHVELVKALHEQGVRYLAAGGTLRLESGLQYLQQLQGFRPVHLELNEVRPPRHEMRPQRQIVMSDPIAAV
jgi:hypothetical protein